MTQQRAPRRESIIGMLRELVSGSVALVKMEIASAKQEASRGGGQLRAAGILLGVGIVFALLCLIALAMLPIAVVDVWLPLWLSVLIFFIVYAVLAGALIFIGVRQVTAAKDSFTIPETRASVQEDVAWAKRLLRRG
jgi:threonine/homoserine/homoserine lactone efflux protein